MGIVLPSQTRLWIVVSLFAGLAVPFLLRGGRMQPASVVGDHGAEAGPGPSQAALRPPVVRSPAERRDSAAPPLLEIHVDYGGFPIPPGGIGIEVRSGAASPSRILMAEASTTCTLEPETPSQVAVSDPRWAGATLAVPPLTPGTRYAATMIVHPIRWLSGEVLAREDGSAVTSFRVKRTFRSLQGRFRMLQEPVAVEDSRGEFRIPSQVSAMADLVSLEIEAEGFLSEVLPETPCAPEGETSLGPILLRRSRTMTIRVIDTATGLPLTESSLRILRGTEALGDLALEGVGGSDRDSGALFFPQTIDDLESDPSPDAHFVRTKPGVFELRPRRSAAFRVVAVAPGFVPTVSEVLSPGSDSEDILLALTRGARLRLTVLVPHGSGWLERIESLEIAGPTGRLFPEAQTDEVEDQLTFEVSGLPDGEYRATLRFTDQEGPGPGPLVSRDFRIDQAHDLDLDIDLGSGLRGSTIWGSVEGPDSMSPTRKVVALLPTDRPDWPNNATVIEDAAFEIPGVDAGDYVLFFGAVDQEEAWYAIASRTISVDGRTALEKDLSVETTEVELQVLDRSGHPMSHRTLYLSPESPGDALWNTLLGTFPMQTSDEGRLRLTGFPAGEYLVSSFDGQVLGSLTISSQRSDSIVLRVEN